MLSVADVGHFSGTSACGRLAERAQKAAFLLAALGCCDNEA